MAPWLAGMGLYALVVGVSGATSGVPGPAAWLTGPTIYSGGAQVAAVDLIGSGAAPAVVVASVLAINARLIVYSGAMARNWAGRPRWWRALAAYLLVDPSFVVGVDGYERHGDRAAGHRHYLGGALLLWVAWLAAIGIGVTLGAQLPAVLRLELIIPLYLVGEVVGKLGDRATRRAAITASVVAAAALAAPMHLGVLLAIIGGLLAALTVKGRSR